VTVSGWQDLAAAAAVVGLVGGATLGVLREFWAFIRRRNRSASLLRLARARTRGVALRNQGAFEITTAHTFHDWERNVDAWAEDARKVLAELWPHEAAMFETIDRIDAAQDVIRDGRYLDDTAIGCAAGENWHARRVAMLASRTRELKVISERYSSATSI
jgi:hypothetical protein